MLAFYSASTTLMVKKWVLSVYRFARSISGRSGRAMTCKLWELSCFISDNVISYTVKKLFRPVRIRSRPYLEHTFSVFHLLTLLHSHFNTFFISMFFLYFPWAAQTTCPESAIQEHFLDFPSQASLLALPILKTDCYTWATHHSYP